MSNNLGKMHDEFVNQYVRERGPYPDGERGFKEAKAMRLRAIEEWERKKDEQPR